jgi:HEAT repeat protein
MKTAAALLKSRKTEDRVRAVHQIARSDDPAKQALLLEALQDRVNYVAALAAEALGECAGESAARAMVERFRALSEDGLKHDPGCHIRAKLAFAFGRLEYSPATEALRIGIRTTQIEAVGGVPFDTAAHLRANCALALAQVRAPDAVRDIAPLLFDTGKNRFGADLKTPLVTIEPRKAAALALARTCDPNALIPLAIRLTYPEGESPEVLQECMQAVVELEDARALELLTPYLRHFDQALAAYAAVMIAQTHAPEAPALLRETLQTLFGDPLRAVVLALTTLRTEAGRAVLHALVDDEREAVRLAVAEALAGASDAEDRKCLQQLAADRSLKVRNAAQKALAE